MLITHIGRFFALVDSKYRPDQPNKVRCSLAGRSYTNAVSVFEVKEFISKLRVVCLVGAIIFSESIYHQIKFNSTYSFFKIDILITSRRVSFLCSVILLLQRNDGLKKRKYSSLVNVLQPNIFGTFFNQVERLLVSFTGGSKP